MRRHSIVAATAARFVLSGCQYIDTAPWSFSSIGRSRIAFTLCAAPCVIAAVAVLALGVVRAGAVRVAVADGMAGRQC